MTIYCLFNPVELIWAQIKRETKKKNSNNKRFMKKVGELTLKAIDNVTTGNLEKCTEHSTMIQEDYSKQGIGFEHV